MKRLILLAVLSACTLFAAQNPVLRNIPDSTWLKMPGSETTLGQDMLIQSCTSYDPVRNRVICYGGGHASEGFENHILVYDLNTLEWRKLYDHDPCSAYSGTQSTGITTSGKPWIGFFMDCRT